MAERSERRGLHWFRNDLRLRDNTALTALVEEVDAWLPVFVLDPDLLEGPSAGAARKAFLFDCLSRLAADLDERGVPLVVEEGSPEEVLPRLMRRARADLLSFNEDVTPYARRRDARVREAVEKAGGEVLARLDHMVYGSAEIRTKTGDAYSVYTPYRKSWWARWKDSPRPPGRRIRLPDAIPGVEARPVEEVLSPPAAANGLDLPTGGEAAAARRLDRFLGGAVRHYVRDRNVPGIDGTSRLSPYLRFGVLSPRQCIERGLEAGREEPGLRRGVSKWLDEIIWREFYSAILEENPRVLRESHRREYESMAWNDDPQELEAWCEARTGYPIVDAGMRQLLATGWMHNRVRMIVASFLTKDLLVDWREGERFFFRHLVDGDPASNNGGWQWAASTGTDAQPYFRIFNPVSQGERYDPDGAYVRRWIPELEDADDAVLHAPWKASSPPRDYPPPVVDHAERRALALELYKTARDQGRRG